jgi:glycosyltransferase involved in cell wall biosynthesis
MAAKVDPADRAYFERVVEPLLDHPLIEFIGEITDAEKSDFIGNAIGLVCPYDWPEPFGLVLIESLACGTPVLAYRRGSIPELIEHGVTGFISEHVGEMASQVEALRTLDRRRCRQVFDERFTSERMSNDYLKIYQRLIQEAAALPRQQGLQRASNL